MAIADDAPIDSYKERQPGWRRQFTLYSDRLVVVAAKPLGNDYVVTVDLRHVRPQYAILRQRKQIAGAGSLILGSMFTFLFVFGLFHGRPEFFPVGAIVNAVLAVVCLAVGLLNIRKIEFYQFATDIGLIAFDIARSGPERHRFDDFVGNAVNAIRAIRAEVRTAQLPAGESASR